MNFNYVPAYRRDKGFLSRLKDTNWLLLIVTVLITISGLIAIGNSTGQQVPLNTSLATRLISVFNEKYVRLQILWFLSGLLIMFLISYIGSYRYLGQFYLFIYGANIILLLILLAFASSTRGAVSWFQIGERGFQPSEFCKLAIIICLAKLLSLKDGKIFNIKQIFTPLSFFLFPFILILLQPDLGTALVYIAIFCIMIFAAGLDFKMILLGIGVASLAIPFSVKYILSDEQRLRLSGFFGMSNASADSNSTYQLNNSLMAIKNGGIKGKGLLTKGSVSQLNFVPDQHTDFVFSSWTEAFGFIGAFIIIVLYFFLLAILIYMAIKTPDKFGKLIIIGVSAMYLFHIFENIGMTFGLMPITGIPLPFMSYGGSAMWTNMFALGLCENVYCRRKLTKF